MTLDQQSKPIVYEDLEIKCPFCNHPLEYIAYTAFHCKNCKASFTIKILKHPEVNPIVIYSK